jgi:hypothetical protein
MPVAPSPLVSTASDSLTWDPDFELVGAWKILRAPSTLGRTTRQAGARLTCKPVITMYAL